LPRSEENLKSPDHCDRAGSSPAPGSNTDDEPCGSILTGISFFSLVDRAG